MTYKLDQIAEDLKEARKAKGISQRALSDIASVPQSHISKIENRGVDLRLSSLIEIARALDLEVELIPRKELSAVRMITKSNKPDSDVLVIKPTKELQRLQKISKKLVDKYPTVKEIGQLQLRIKDLSKLKIHSSSLNQIKNVSRSLDAIAKGSTDLAAIKESIVQLQHLQNQLVYEQGEHIRKIDIPSRYTLDDVDDV